MQMSGLGNLHDIYVPAVTQSAFQFISWDQMCGLSGHGTIFMVVPHKRPSDFVAVVES